MELAVVCTYLPDEDQVLSTTFKGEKAIERAQAFKRGEEERNDFPGSVWGIIANEEAREAKGQRFVDAVTGGR